MPRQSRTDRLLAEQEQRLTNTRDEAKSALAQAQTALELVRDLRSRLAAAPKRTRAKRLVPANTQPATATAA